MSPSGCPCCALNVHKNIATGLTTKVRLDTAATSAVLARWDAGRAARRPGAAGPSRFRLSRAVFCAARSGLILVISVYEGGLLGLLVAVTIGIFGGLMNKLLGMHAGVQFMAYYMAVLFIPKLIAERSLGRQMY